MIEYLFKNILGTFLLPPGINILLILLGLLLMRWFYRSGRFLLILGFVSLIAFSLPIVKTGLYALLETYPPLTHTQLARPSAQAIVILGGGVSPHRAEYDGKDKLSIFSLERVMYGAYLHRQTGLPILVTGGQVYNHYTPEAVVMQQTLLKALNTPVRWVEDKSKNTMENALFSQSLLNRDKIHRIYLVTHARHMPRAVWAFRKAGLDVIPAPMGFQSKSNGIDFHDFLPDATSLARVSYWGHEVLGLLWYRLRY